MNNKTMELLMRLSSTVCASAFLLLLTGLSIGQSAHASPIDLTKLPSIKNQKSCFHDVFASYDTWLDFLSNKRAAMFKKRGMQNADAAVKKFENGFRRMFSKADFDAAKQALNCQRFTYQVNSQNVEGVLLTPKDLKSSKTKIPLVVYNRGGTRGLGELVFGHIAHELFPIAREGFAIIASNYRKDETYGSDNIDEVAQLLKIAEQLPNIQSDKVHLYGISRGGLTSMQLAREVPAKVASIVSISGVTNSELWAQNRKGIANNLSLIDGYKENPSAIHHQLSPVQWVDELPNVPVLLIHSKDDAKVSVEHALQLTKELETMKRQHKALIYPEGGHSLAGHKKAARAEALKWFRSANP